MSDRSEGVLFGETALERGFITAEQLQAALAQQEERGAGIPLGAVMVSMGLLTMPQATAIEKLNAALRKQQDAEEDEEVNLIGRTLGGCLVLEKLATGSMGTTYKAHHMRLDRNVVVKVLHPRMVMVEGNLERFAREARYAAKLEHPAIVSVYDFDSEGDTHFIVMQYVKGQDLRQVLEGRGALGARRALWIGARVLEGLAHAHSKAIVHRDIKPANLLITPEPRIKIADFGLVRILSHSTGEELSSFGEIIGTPQYMSPEQAIGDEFDHRADIYALGITVFELICGRPPFSGNSTMEVLEKHIMEPFPSLREFVPGAAAELDAFFARMCAKKQEDRFPDANAALAAIQGMRFERDGTTRKLQRIAPGDPSRSEDAPPIVSEQALEQLKDRLRQSRSFVAFEEDADGNVIEASFSTVPVVPSDELTEVRERLSRASEDAERDVPRLMQAMIREGKDEQLIQLAREFEGALPSSAAVAFYLGRAHDNGGQLEEARAKFALASVLSPDHLQARLHLARVLVAMGRVEEAVATLREATHWHPSSVHARVRLAEVLYVVKSDREAAAEAYEKAIELAPSRWQLRQQLAWVLYELGRYDRAEAVLEEVVAWRGGDAEPAKKLLAQVRRKRDRKRSDGAKTPEEEAEEAGSKTSAHLVAVRLATASGKWKRVLQAAEEGLERSPRSVELLLAKASACRELGRSSDAVQAYGMALSIDPDNEAAQQGLLDTQAERKSRRFKKP